MSQGGFSIPVVPEAEAAQRILEQKAERESVRRREVRAECAKVLDQLPRAFQYPANELLTRPKLDPLLRSKVNALTTPTLSAFLLGPSGVGKTTMAAVLVKRALAEYAQSLGERCQEVAGLKWIDAPELSLCDRRHPLGDGRPAPLAEACNARSLVIDDIGLEQNQGPLLEVLRFRYNQLLPTITTSGLTKQQLTGQISGAGVRRLREQHAGYPVLVVDVHPPIEKAGGKSQSKA